MKATISSKNIIIYVISLFYALLFVYAAVSKLIDFENFQVELGQSPLLSAFAQWISWAVIVTELIISVLFFLPKYRIIAMYAAFCLMTMFSVYIYVILNYSSFVPCSCGGILGKMSWNEHLIFNISCVLLALLAICLHYSIVKTRFASIRGHAFILFLLFISSAGIVVILFLFSEDIMQHKNPFIRRYPHHPVTLAHTIDLKYNSYYIAGQGNGQIYLGNSTVPLNLLIIDSTMKHQNIRVTLDSNNFLFKSLKINVRPPFFYIIDGGVPTIFRGKTSNWKAKILSPDPPYFNVGIPIDSTSVVFRGIDSKTDNNIIGLYKAAGQPNIKMLPKLLEKQIDGVFDTDGMLHYSDEMKRIVYLYSYRNEYIVANENGVLNYRAHTIDTFSKAKIKVAHLKGNTERAMAAPAITVNKTSSVFGHLLFVNSNVQGRYEQKKVWEQASAIDVYDLYKKTYLFSFHVYGINDKKVRSFIVTSEFLYALIDDKLVVYKLNDKLKNEINRVVQNKN